MRKTIGYGCLSLCLGVVVGLAGFAPSADEPRVVAITAKRFEFSPSQIVLKKGETVKFQVTSQDVRHGLFLKPLGLDLDIVPGKTVEATVTPQVAGKFSAICDIFCGAQHGNMKMTVLVTE